MAFLPYDYKLQDKIESSDVWKLKTDIPCERGFYEKGTRLFSKDIIILLYDNDTQECVLNLKEKYTTDGMEIKINANDFEKYFEVDHQMNNILTEKNKAKEERNLNQFPYEVGQMISGLLALFIFLLKMPDIYKQDFSDISLIHLLLLFLPICIPTIIFLMCTILLVIFNSRYNKIVERLEAEEKMYLSEEYNDDL